MHRSKKHFDPAMQILSLGCDTYCPARKTHDQGLVLLELAEEEVANTRIYPTAGGCLHTSGLSAAEDDSLVSDIGGFIHHCIAGRLRKRQNYIYTDDLITELEYEANYTRSSMDGYVRRRAR